MNCEGWPTASTVGRLLHTTVRVNSKSEPQHISPFDSTVPSTIAIEDYSLHLMKAFRCSEEPFVLAVIFLNRVLTKHPEITPSEKNIHRLLLCSLLLAIKVRDDIRYDNRYYAKAGGVSVVEMNYLEQCFLKLIDFEVYVDLPEFVEYLQLITMKAGELGVRCQELLNTHSGASTPSMESARGTQTAHQPAAPMMMSTGRRRRA
eukprot:Sspe_Gene.5620::Locus_1861_Transcript_1_3_Confidence_0.500_Length_1333::g.5620::m.5620